MSKKKNDKNSKSPGWHTVTPRIVARDASKLVSFLKRIFAAEGKWEEDRPSMITIGDTLIMISEAGIRDPFPAFLYVYVPNADETYGRAIKAGATSLESPAKTPYGDYRAMVRDPWGNTWQIATNYEPKI